MTNTRNPIMIMRTSTRTNLRIKVTFMAVFKALPSLLNDSIIDFNWMIQNPNIERNETRRMYFVVTPAPINPVIRKNKNPPKTR